MKKYIYIDTKIKGAIIQLTSYYQNGIFDNTYTVIFKRYPKNQRFLKYLDKYDIHYITFKYYKEFPKLNGDIIFYLFNAQSNCRIVANRDAKHIFVTHGESNKLPSVKPILRIYDSVIVAGDAGINRLLKTKIFTKCDLEHKKLFKMGNTFIGNAHYKYLKNSKCILYAPTWEGGIEEENYSSISSNNQTFQTLASYMKQEDFDTIIIQIHPNLGHRDIRYLYYLYRGVQYLKHQGVNIKIRKIDIFTPLSLYFHYTNMYIDNHIVNISEAFCDVSALETQLLDKEIPTHIFLNNKQIAKPEEPFLEKYYDNITIINHKIKKFPSSILDDIKKVKQYYIAYEEDILAQMTYIQRIEWLIKKC